MIKTDFSDEHARHLLQTSLGNESARFRDGQLLAIRAIVYEKAKLLVVQRTGWGKSMVYFLATRLLRDQGAGPTILVSPLLALMRNQIEAAERIGIRARTINSANISEWTEVEDLLFQDAVDVLLISPERLGNERFRESILKHVAPRTGLLVVDEAHCISDWGHDFRPDYRRIVRILQNLPSNIPVLATTATANDRVVADVVAQIGPSLRVIRGRLERQSLRLQTIRLATPPERMAWLAQTVPTLPGSGIVYTRTVRDCEKLAEWLQHKGIRSEAYHGQSAAREEREQDLLENRIKVLVATSALGMGFDKPDLAFVIHFQRPGSVVEYYQQVGRAGRNGKPAYGVLLSGDEDDNITDFFIRTAFPSRADIDRVLHELDESDDGLKVAEIADRVNIPDSTIQKVLKILDVHSPSPVVKEGARWMRTAVNYTPDLLHIEKLTEIRRAEQTELNRYMDGEECHMAFLRKALDDPDAEPCFQCAPCKKQPLLDPHPDRQLVLEALNFQKRGNCIIEPRKQYPNRTRIPVERQMQQGRALAWYWDAGWGSEVRNIESRNQLIQLERTLAQLGQPSILDKKQAPQDSDSGFGEEMMEALCAMIRSGWNPEPRPEWVCGVPSIRHPDRVANLARFVASNLHLPYYQAIQKIRETGEQKDQANSSFRVSNLEGAFHVTLDKPFIGKPVFLVDDIVESRWTMTCLAQILLEAGSGPVFPVALALKGNN